MPNRRIDPEEKVKKRNLCFTDKDWDLFNSLVGINHFNLSGVSALLRLLSKSVVDNMDLDLGRLSAELKSQGYPGSLRGLITRTLDINDKIHN